MYCQQAKKILYSSWLKSQNLFCHAGVSPYRLLASARTTARQNFSLMMKPRGFIESSRMVMSSTSTWPCLHNNWNCSNTSKFHTDAVKYNETSFALVHVLKEIKASPAPALVFGLAGLIPFVTVPCYFMYGGEFISQLAIAQLAYGATILSFLGGVRWGFTLPDSVSHELTWRNLGWSVTPSLLACSALLMPYTFGTLTLIGGIGGAAYLDLMYQAYPTWFKALRFCLSLIAALSLWTSLVLSFILKEQQ